MSATPRARRADAARNREAVLDAAQELLAREGPGVSTDSIARRAGVGPGTVYRHFATKESLVAAVVERRLEQVVAAGEALAASEGAEALFAFLRAMATEWAAADVRLAQVLLDSDDLLGDTVAQSEARFIELLQTLLDQAQDAGAVGTDVTVRDVKALIVAGQAVHSFDPSLAERAVATMVDGLRATD